MLYLNESVAGVLEVFAQQVNNEGSYIKGDELVVKAARTFLYAVDGILAIKKKTFQSASLELPATQTFSSFILHFL